LVVGSELFKELNPRRQSILDEASGRKWERFAGSGFILKSLDASNAALLPEL